MRIALTSPELSGVPSGNRATARRWAAIWRSLGHQVSHRPTAWRRADLLVALHAGKTAAAVLAFRAAHPRRWIVVAFTGTDLYPRPPVRGPAARAVAAADRCVALQPLALKALPSGIRAKTRVIYQSAPTPRGRGPGARSGRFEVLVAAHLRAVKDPLRAARASRTLPPESRVRVLHAGAALSPDWALRAEAEMRRNPRYRWLGVLPPLSARRRIAAARLLIVSSRLEGGPNVISEAAVNGVPVLATRVSGNVGLLGAGYGGYFAAGDTAGLARLLRRAETDPTFLTRLRRQVRVQARLFTPRREREAWRRLLREMTAGGGG